MNYWRAFLGCFTGSTANFYCLESKGTDPSRLRYSIGTVEVNP